MKAEENWKETQRRLNEAQTAYDSLSATVQQNTRDIEDYNYAATLAAEGTAETYQKLADMTKKTYTENGKTVETAIARQIQAEQIQLKETKKINQEAIENNNETQEKLTQTSIDESNKRLNALADELRGMTSITNENSEDVKDAWKALATDSYDIYNEKVSQYPLATQIAIQEMTGVAVTKAPEFSKVMEYIAQLGIDSLDKDEEFKNKALESLNGYLAGLTDEEKRKLLKDAGIENIDLIMQELEKGDLSEEKGKEILKGLYNGLEDKGFKANLFGAATTLSSQLSAMLTIKPNIASVAGIGVAKSSIPGHKDGLDYVPYDNYIARLHQGERVLTAEENKNYMADNIENKITNRNIVVQFYPQHMTEQEIQRAEDYIAKKWGMAW